MADHRSHIHFSVYTPSIDEEAAPIVLSSQVHGRGRDSGSAEDSLPQAM